MTAPPAKRRERVAGDRAKVAVAWRWLWAWRIA
jgi:hypothetical protein